MVRTAVQKEHILLVPIAWLTIEAKTPHWFPVKAPGPLPQPPPPQMTTNSTSGSLMIFSCFSLPRVLYHALPGEMREEGEERGKRDFIRTHSLFFQGKATIWLKHPKIFMKFVICQSIIQVFFSPKKLCTKYKLFFDNVPLRTVSDFYCRPDIS